MSLEPASPLGKIVGVVGGVASGKSAVTQFLAELGGIVLNADAMAHDVLQQPQVVDALVEHFGAQVLLTFPSQEIGSSLEKEVRTAERVLNRSAIGKLVFGKTEQHRVNMQYLESVVQTQVRDRLIQEIECWRKGAEAKSFLVLDVPLLFERGWDRFCDYVLMVDTPDAKRMENAVRRGWSESDWRAREQIQLALSDKRDRATYSIPNDSSLENLRTRVRDWYATHLGDR
ncbi:MAG: dephospho-CoA kinase [Pirellula sp.]|jgi:dephospho-CoA kinase|nr:dephospho-CoA kinase [Pirellula sp.]